MSSMGPVLNMRDRENVTLFCSQDTESMEAQMV